MNYVSLVCLAFLAVAASAAADSKVNYNGHMVIRVVPKTQEQLKHLANLQSSSSTDFWRIPKSVNSPVDIRVSPDNYYNVARNLAAVDLSHDIHVLDLGEAIRKEEKAILMRRGLKIMRDFDFGNYNTYADIMKYLNNLAKSNALVSTSVAGVTSEGRDVLLVTISRGLEDNATRPAIFFDCDIHAREWITTATCLNFINTLVSDYGVDQEITTLVNSYDWLFVPITNPDGYDYTWTNDRLWRKNRVVNADSRCTGVDANRNLGAGFNPGSSDGASDLPCSETYRGPKAFSEKESSALRDIIQANSGRILAAISIHSYSQLWMSPYGYKSELPTNYSQMYEVMKAGVNALEKTYGTLYDYGNTADTIYVASGITTDYYYENGGIFHSYTIELRDTGLSGFILPPSQINPTFVETWNGIKAMIKAIENL